MEEGKLPINLLDKLIATDIKGIQGVIQGPQVGCDVAVIDYIQAIKRAQQFYNSKEKVYVVFKTDPITFPTPDPGRYSVVVNANDVVTSGAIPYGFNATIILPLNSSPDQVFQIQKGIHEVCYKMNIAVLGGHTEISSSVNTPIISGAMLGFVPKDYYVPREITKGDVMLCVGWCMKEGAGIIASEGYKKLVKKMSKSSLEKLIELGSEISIVDSALEINKKYQPGLMHDATEGGILGAAYETIVPEGFGLELESEKFPFTKETLELCEILGVNPFRVISSGTLLVVITEEKANELIKNSTEKTPIAKIGKITAKEKTITLDGEKIQPPGPDAIIDALKKLEEGDF